jgi:hypothetical protein
LRAAVLLNFAVVPVRSGAVLQPDLRAGGKLREIRRLAKNKLGQSGKGLISTAQVE